MRFTHCLTALGLVAAGAALPATAQTVADPGFELPDINDNYAYRPTGSPWTFTGDAGVIDAPSDFDRNDPAPEGSQYAFVQGESGFISQDVSGFVVGQQYQIGFQYVARSCCGPTANANPFNVLADGAVVGTFTPPQQTDTGTFTFGQTAPFTANDTTLTIAFDGLGVPGNDTTTFLDAIQIVPEPTAPAVMAAAALGLAAGRRRRPR